MAEPSSTLCTSKRPAPKLKPEDSSKSLPNLLYKIAFVAVFAAILPLFPSQAPEFIGESMFTGAWELLHLLFVGVAVSYGIFSRRNADPDSAKEPPPKDGSPRSFVSQMLHDSLGFGDEEEDELGSPIGGMDASRIDAWSSRYQRSEPSTLVAGVGNGTAEQVSSKPLLLPVRSLKVQDQDARNRSTDSVVLPSPIPWKSRTGVMEIKEVTSRPSVSSLAPRSSFDAEEVVSKAMILPLPSSPRPPPLKNRFLSPSASSEVRSKGGGNAVEPKTTYKFTPPPAPPPPPPGYLGHGNEFPSTPERRVTDRSFKEELKYWHSTNHKFADPPVSSQRSYGDGASSVGMSVRTLRPKEVQTADTGGGKKTSFEARLPPPVPKFTTEDSDSDGAEDVERPPAKEGTSSSAAEAAIQENEVDKKADEFIAKFREQIRLQRIDSIKRSTKQRNNKETGVLTQW